MLCHSICHTTHGVTEGNVVKTKEQSGRHQSYGSCSEGDDGEDKQVLWHPRWRWRQHNNLHHSADLRLTITTTAVVVNLMIRRESLETVEARENCSLFFWDQREITDQSEITDQRLKCCWCLAGDSCLWSLLQFRCLWARKRRRRSIKSEESFKRCPCDVNRDEVRGTDLPAESVDVADVVHSVRQSLVMELDSGHRDYWLQGYKQDKPGEEVFWRRRRQRLVWRQEFQKNEMSKLCQSLSHSQCVTLGWKWEKWSEIRRQRRGKGLSCKLSYILEKLNRKSAWNLQCRLHSLRMFTYLKQALRAWKTAILTKMSPYFSLPSTSRNFHSVQE